MKGSACVLHQWPATLHRVTFFDGCPFSSCERGRGIQNPIAWLGLRERLHQAFFLMSSLFLAQQGRALHAAHSVVCFHTKPCSCHLRSVSHSGEIIGRRARSRSTLGWVVAASPAPECLLLHISILRQQSCPAGHLKVDERNEGSSPRFLSGHMFLNGMAGTEERLT